MTQENLEETQYLKLLQKSLSETVQEMTVMEQNHQCDTQRYRDLKTLESQIRVELNNAWRSIQKS